MQKADTKDPSITTRILRTLYGEVSLFVTASNLYSNEADFIRDAVREKLDRETKN